MLLKLSLLGAAATVAFGDLSCNVRKSCRKTIEKCVTSDVARKKVNADMFDNSVVKEFECLMESFEEEQGCQKCFVPMLEYELGPDACLASCTQTIKRCTVGWNFATHPAHGDFYYEEEKRVAKCLANTPNDECRFCMEVSEIPMDFQAFSDPNVPVGNPNIPGGNPNLVIGNPNIPRGNPNFRRRRLVEADTAADAFLKYVGSVISVLAKKGRCALAKQGAWPNCENIRCFEGMTRSGAERFCNKNEQCNAFTYNSEAGKGCFKQWCNAKSWGNLHTSEQYNFHYCKDTTAGRATVTDPTVTAPVAAIAIVAVGLIGVFTARKWNKQETAKPVEYEPLNA